jgi:heterodisulfide reductase subunit A
MTDSILVVGGGVAGLHTALECAKGGAKAIVVERGPVLGGRLAATMLEPSAIGDRAEGVRTPLFNALEGNPDIEFLTLAELEGIEGRAGNFTASIRQKARWVTEDCTRCKNCHTVCPQVRANEYDAGLTHRKAIYTPMSDTLPEPYLINIEDCLNTPPNYLPCNRCIEVCDDNAIHFDMPLETMHQRQVGAVILAPGFRTEDPGRFVELGYGAHPDVVSSAELQRLLEDPGPTGGFASKPSNEEYPESVLLVLDSPSPFALYIVASQVHQLLEQDVDKVAVLILAQPSDESEPAAQALAEKAGIEVFWGAMFKVDPSDEGVLEVSYEDLTVNRFLRGAYDMVVLCNDVEPPPGLAALAEAAGVELSDSGYLQVNGGNGSVIGTSRPGVFVAGCASGPKNIRASLDEAQAAASAATAALDPRLLQPEGEEAAAAEQQPPGSGQTPPDDLRRQLEQLLNALVNR